MQQDVDSVKHRWDGWRLSVRFLALLTGAIGVALIPGGGRLLWLGGTPYFLLMGLALIASAVLLWQLRASGARLYGLVLLFALGWAVFATNSSPWPLAGRLALLFVMGSWLILPPVRRRLAGATAMRFSHVAAAAVAAVLVGFAARGMFNPSSLDPAFRVGVSTLPDIPSDPPAAPVDWAHWGNDRGGMRHSGLTQITPQNVHRLRLLWTYRTGDAPPGHVSFQTTPLQIADAIYFCTGYNDVIALDAETGREIWRRSLDVDLTDVAGLTCRGVSYYRIPDASGVCAERIITATLDARLIALDRRTGEPCMGFGHHGAVSLLEGMGPVTKGYYYITSPPTIVRGRIVLGGWVTDGQYWGEPSGVIRAFDAVDGRLAWAFDMGQPDRTGLPAPGDHYTRATPNSWAPMSADEALGMVYVPTGNATPDYFGEQRRSFDDAYSSSVVALDVATGRPRWTFQTTHHDLWDYDVASQPTLVDLDVGGNIRRLLLQPTKRGELFVLDRVTGEPAFPVVERPVPAHGHAPGERLAVTQPFSPALPAFSGPDLTEDSMWGLTPVDELWCRLRFLEARYEGVFTPPGLTPYIQYPGYLGGFDWGSISVDPTRRIAVFNTSRMANRNRLLSRAEAETRGIRARRAGNTEFVGGPVAQEGTPFAADIQPFLSPLGVPCQAPPYSMLSAIDLSSGKLVWHRPLGTAQDAGPWSLKLGLPLPMGSPSLGGAVTTASGITFIAATQDRYLRAFDSRTGEQLWRSRLPAGGHAVPMTYLAPQNGRQVVIIAAGGSGLLKSKAGNHLVAYALPADSPQAPADRPR